jgi:hypothetical protein
VAAWRYPRLGGVTVLAIVGDPVSAAERRRLGPSLPESCRAKLAGVLIRDGRVELYPHVLTGPMNGVACANEPVDEKVFWMFADGTAGCDGPGRCVGGSKRLKEAQ